MVALETENKSLKSEQATAQRKAIADAALTEAKLPQLGKSGEIDLDARFKKQLEQAAISADTDEAAKAEVTTLIAERKALLGNSKVTEEKGNNKPGITPKSDSKPVVNNFAFQLGI